jgi:hypothetical protein
LQLKVWGAINLGRKPERWIDHERSCTMQRLQLIVSVLVTVIGLALMSFKIYADSEPGAIPILLVLAGISWFVFAKTRKQERLS